MNWEGEKRHMESMTLEGAIQELFLGGASMGSMGCHAVATMLWMYESHRIEEDTTD